jgi:pimeloyl-ACP methyl ester carboxylesterase
MAENEPEAEPQFITLDDTVHGRRQIATLPSAPGPAGKAAAGLFWLPGLRSDMASTKASAVAGWAARTSTGMTRFDYSGHGRSEGRFEDGTIGLWLADAFGVYRHRARGPQILIGSSMGGWIALRMLQELRASAGAWDAAPVAGLILIAPAWDMTERLIWQAMAPAARAAIERDGVWLRPSEYAPDGYPITRALIEEGRKHLLPERLKVECPVHILHGRLDADVPFAHSQALLARLAGLDVVLTEVPDGDHRLSREADIAQLLAVVAGMVG